MTATAVLSRVFVAANLSVKALYSDNSLFLLASNGSTFSSIDPHGNRVTQLTLYAISRYKSKLAQVLSFRNLHTGPVLTVASLQTSSYFLGYKITSVKWSLSPAIAEAEGLLRFETDGSVVLDSEDNAAMVVLHPNQRRIAVCYPLLIPGAKTSKHQYIWQTQLFAVEETPLPWHYPLHTLQQALAASHSEQQTTTEGPTAQYEQSSLNRITDLPVAVTPDTTLTTFPKQSWWYDCSHMLPQDIPILLEWTPDAIYQYIPTIKEVAVWIHVDESCLLSEGKGSFLKHCRGQHQPERLYAAEAVPLHTNTEGVGRYPLAQFAEHALALRQLGSGFAAKAIGQAIQVSHDADSCSEDDSPDSQLASKIHEQHEVADDGKFTAYMDGSVRVAFHDRTLLYLKPSHTHCDVITLEGHRVTVSTATPVGVEQYVEQALEFAEWAFSTPAQRASVLQKAASIQKELGKCQRAVALCDWAQGNLPMSLNAPEQQHLVHVVEQGDNARVCNDELHSVLHQVGLNGEISGCPSDCPSSAERECVIQALLAKSSQLLSTLT